eukprot:m.40507 g.40507  ORF g.40507 m.40507 type:complete len:2127 (+) comp32973_c0_seq6:608-6988(+)
MRCLKFAWILAVATAVVFVERGRQTGADYNRNGRPSLRPVGARRALKTPPLQPALTWSPRHNLTLGDNTTVVVSLNGKADVVVGIEFPDGDGFQCGRLRIDRLHQKDSRSATIQWERERLLTVVRVDVTGKRRLAVQFQSDGISVWVDCQKRQTMSCRNCLGRENVCLTVDRTDAKLLSLYNDVDAPCRSTWQKTSPIWMAWSQWTFCSATCGRGIQTRERACHHRQKTEVDLKVSSSPSLMCEGERTQTKACTNDECPSPLEEFLTMFIGSDKYPTCQMSDKGNIQQFYASNATAFRPNCDYTLAGGCGGDDEPDFSIVARWDDCDDGKTCIVRVTIKDDEADPIVLTRSSAYINGMRFDFSEMRKVGSKSVIVPLNDESGFVVRLISQTGYQIFYSPSQLKISVSRSAYGDPVCGLCGILNTALDASSGLSSLVGGSSPGRPLTLTEQAVKYRLPGECPHCEAIPLSASLAKAFSGYCFILRKTDGPFAPCHGVVEPEPYLNLCAHHTCQCSSDEKDKCRCDSLAEYARKCGEKGVVLSWRSAQFCHRTCPGSMVYQECGCSFTCKDYQDGKDLTKCPACKSGCFCAKGDVLQRRQSLACRPTTSCECEKNASDFTGLQQREKTCHCIEGKWTCFTEPHFFTKTEPVYTVLHRSVELRCEAGGYPKPTVTLWHDGQLLSQGSGTATHVIPYVETPALGNYSCVAKSKLGEAKAELILRKAVKPRIMSLRSSSPVVSESCPLTMACEVDGSPMPTVTWYRDGKTVKDEMSNCKSMDGGWKCRLKFREVNESVAGRYRCVATNNASSVAKEIRQSVELIQEGVLKFVVKPEDDKIAEGATASFRCEATGNPCPDTVTWWRNGRILQERDADIRKHRLIIRNSTVSNSGYYECEVTNKKGMVIRAGATLTVLDGKWDVWSSWSSCSASCGQQRFRTRQRNCLHSGSCSGKRVDAETSKCASIKCPGQCYTWGHFNAVTFDGRPYSFRGTCKYYLARDCLGDKPAVYYISQECNAVVSGSGSGSGSGGRPELYRKAVFIGFIKEGGEFKMEGDEVRVIQKGVKYTVVKDGMFVTFRADGLTVRFDGVSRVYVEVEEKYGKVTCGLCGTYNNDANDDFADVNGNLMKNTTAFAKSHVINSDASNEGTCVTEATRACDNMPESCRIFEGDKGFQQCHGVVSYVEFQEQCRRFVCDCLAAGVEARHCACGAILDYVGACRLAGVKVELPDGHCSSGHCKNGRVFTECNPFAPKTCKDVSSPFYMPPLRTNRCRKPTKPDRQFRFKTTTIDCYCPIGDVLHDGHCIHKSSCPCVHARKEYPAGYGRFIRNKDGEECMCTCVDSGWECPNSYCKEARLVNEPPQAQVALTGQSLTLCCGQRSLASPTRYHWFQNGTKMPGERDQTLLIKNVEPSSAGTYMCQIGSFGLMSKIATVTVNDRGHSSCPSKPLSRKIALPQGCRTKKDSLRKLDVKQCPELPCARSGGTSSKCGDPGYCCGPAWKKSVSTAEIVCDGSIKQFHVPIIDECECHKCKDRSTAVYGHVSWAANKTDFILANVVNIDPVVGKTGEGFLIGEWFHFAVPDDVQYLGLKFIEMRGSLLRSFPPFVKLVPFAADKRTYHRIRLPSWSLTQNVTSVEPETLKLFTRNYSRVRLTTSLNIGRNSFVLTSATSQVRLMVAYADSVSTKDPEDAPGNYEQIFSDGSRGLIKPLFIVQISVLEYNQQELASWINLGFKQPLGMNILVETTSGREADDADGRDAVISSCSRFRCLQLFSLLESSGFYSKLPFPVVSLPVHNTYQKAIDGKSGEKIKLAFPIPKLDRTFAVGKKVATCYARVGATDIVGHRISGISLLSTVRHEKPFMTTSSRGITGAGGVACMPIACHLETFLTATQALGSSPIPLDPGPRSYRNRTVSFHHNGEIHIHAEAPHDGTPVYPSLDQCEAEKDGDRMFGFVTSDLSTSFTAVESYELDASWRRLPDDDYYYAKVRVVSHFAREYNVHASTFFIRHDGTYQLYGWRQQRTAGTSNSTVCLEFAYPMKKNGTKVVVMIDVRPAVVAGENPNGPRCYKTKRATEFSAFGLSAASDKTNEFKFHPPTELFGNDNGIYRVKSQDYAEADCHNQYSYGTVMDFLCS